MWLAFKLNFPKNYYKAIPLYARHEVSVNNRPFEAEKEMKSKATAEALAL